VKPHNKSILQALLVVFLWSTSWVFIKFGLKQISPLTFAGLRYSFAFFVLLGVLILQRKQLGKIVISRRTWLLLLLLAALLYAGAQGGQFIALAYMPSTSVNLLFSFSSVIVAIIGAAWLGERLTWHQWIGLALTLAGSWVYFFPASIPHGQMIGLIAALIALLSNSISTVVGRDINRSNQLSPLLVSLIPMGIGSGILLAVGVSIEGIPHIDLKGWVIILWLAVVNTAFAFTLWNHTLRTLTAIESSIINSTMMIWIPLLAVLILRETLTTRQVLGLVVTAVGAWIVQFRAYRKPLKVSGGG